MLRLEPTPTRRWKVRRSYFPLALPGSPLGEVEANTRAEAEQLAVAQFGGLIAVEPIMARDVRPLERAVRKLEQEAARRRGRTVPRHNLFPRRGHDEAA